MNKSKNRKKYICIFLSVIILGYICLTPTGALRASVALSGHPISAFTMKVRVATAEDVGLVALDNPKNSTIYRIESHIPHDKPTDGDLKNWIVYKHFCFYTARYYGWC